MQEQRLKFHAHNSFNKFLRITLIKVWVLNRQFIHIHIGLVENASGLG